MTAKASVTRAELARMLRAVTDAGLTVSEIVMADGEARFVLASKPEVTQSGRPIEW